MSTIASLVATLGLDASQFNKGISDAKDQAGMLDKGLNGFKTAALVGATTSVVALGAGLASSVNVASGFEKQMDAVGAVAGASETELAGLGKTALRIGEETAFGATEMGGAMEILAGSGMSATQIMNGAADATAALAAAGGTDLATAAGVASTAMGVWGLEAEQLTDVVNRVAGAANVSKFGVEDMAGAMAMGGGAAASAGVDFEDFSTTIGATAKYFSSGSDAGTSFKTFLTRLAAPTGEAATLMEELGIQAFNADGSMKGMGEIAGILQSSLGGLTEEQRGQAMATLFGADATRTAIGLMELGEQGFSTMSDTMKNTDAAAVAAQRMNNFSGAMDQVGGAIETLQIKIGSALLPVLTSLATALANGIPVAAAAVAAGFAALMSATEPVRAAIATFAVTLASEVMPHLQAFADWFTSSSDAMGAAGAAIGGVLVAGFIALGVAAGAAAVSVLIALAPIIAVTVAAAALGAGIYLLITHWDAVVQAFPAAGVALNAVKDGWASVLSWITGTFVPGITGIADAIGEAGSRALGFAQGHWSQIQAVIDGVLMFIITQVQNVFSLIGGIIEGQLMVVSGIIKTFTGLLSGDWSTAWEGIKEIVRGVWTAISAVIEYQIATIKNIVTNLGPALVAILSMAWDLLKNVTTAAWDGIKAGVSAGVAALPGLISAAGAALSSAASTAWDAVKSAVSSAWDAIKAFVTAGIAALPGLISAGAGLLLSAGQTAFEGVKSGFNAVWDAIAAWVPTLPGIAANLIKDGVGLLLEAGRALLDNMWEGAKAVWDTALTWAGTLPGLAKEAIVAGVGLLMEAGKSLIDNMKTGLASAFVDVKAYVGTFPGKMVEALGDLGGILLSAGKAIAGGLKDGLVAGFEAVKGEVSSWGGKIASLKGPESYDKALLVPAGHWIAEGLQSGLNEGFASQVAPEVAEWGDRISAGMDPGLVQLERDMERKARDAAMNAMLAMKAGLHESSPAVIEAIGNIGAMSGDTAITSTINAIQDGSVDLEAAWKDIEERMKKINDTAATSGGASYAQRWYQSMLDGIAAGTVSAATAVEIMTGVLYNAATWTGNGASPQRQDWVAFLQSQLDALMKNNAEMISDTFHGPPTEDTTGIGQGNDYWDRLAREIEARMGGRRTPGEDSAKTKTKHKYGPQIPDPLEEMSVLDKAVSEMISDGIIDIADVLKARTGGFDPLAEALLQGIAGMFSSADISKLANLGLGDELIMAIFEMLTPQIPDSAVGPMDDDEGMWVPSEEDQNSFVGQSVVYEVHLDGAGYISDVDALARDLELAASRRGE